MEVINVNNLNEYIDWVSGINSVTGAKVQGVDANTRISGGSIRELLQNKLKVPFVTNESDENKDKIYFFSSEYAKNLWKNYTDNSNPQYDLEKAAELVLYSMDLPATYKITGLNVLNSTRYIIEGNANSENAVLQFELGIVDSLDSEQQDSITLTYNIQDEAGNTTLDRTVPVDAGSLGDTIRTNIYLYLRSGRNKVTVSASCNNLNARTSTSFYVYLIKFQITSDFSGYYRAISNNTATIPFNVSVSRSITNLPIRTTISVKEQGLPAQLAVFTGGSSVWNYTDRESNFSKRLEIVNSYQPGKKYTMEIRSEMVDQETNQSFSSNVLIYQFEVASSTEIDNGFINTAYTTSIDKYSTDTDSGEVILVATLYMPFTMDWGYHTDIANGWSLIDISWYIRKGTEEYVYSPLVSMTVSKGSKPETLKFISSTACSFEHDNSYLVARGTINNVTYDIAEFPITVIENLISVTEAEGALKLSAYGKTNTSDTKNEWVDSISGVTTTFSSGVTFDNNSGWNADSLILRGTNAYATVNYCPFPSQVGGNPYNLLESGAAFHIDFKPEYVNDDQDAILTIGGSDTTAPRIIITPNSAGFYAGSSATVKTNFKSGERISLTFIINKVSQESADSGLVYIVNNGILERAGTMSAAQLYDNSGVIKIGGSNSGIRVYSIRAYRTDIEVKQALSTYMFDNVSNAELLSRNDIYGGLDSILYSQLQGKQDLIIISTNPNDPKGLSEILNNASLKRNATVDIERYSTDSSKNFTIAGCRIRNHGQSTLSYPITSMKIWLNKSNIIVNNVELTPEFVCMSQQHLGLNKNRYVMKNNAIPSNKFVLQANYADSSGTHNGSLLRLIQDTWYNALIDNEYKLRTAPQLFSSGVRITHNDLNLHENGTWVEGLYNISPSATNKSGNYIYRTDWANKTWPEITNTQFPYTIRNAADSFPCTVFYKEGENNLTLLGQYVFMDDKKADYVFGERSIYYTDDTSDPFCLKVENSKKDDKSNLVWDNEKVLQIEVVYPNSPLTSYVSKTVADSYTVDENDDSILIPSGEQHSYSDIYYVDGKAVSYYWEQHFELIYPDEDDLTGDKFQQDSDFAQKVQPFLEFLEWITDCKLNYNKATKWWNTNVYASTQAAFEATAHDHLDMYKLAAYYVFFLRFGLVDSVERNAQLKTYDGLHWHYEPWDMDIALGCANNGVIAYEPPLSRDSKKEDGVSYAFAGKTRTQSNTLWDCLEGWTYWSDELVPKVAEALFKAGLSYTNAAKMFDEEYVEKWSETLYNESGHYKYIDAASDPKWRLYLNGARTSHRHWWLSKSMNFYDAKWGCGDFTTHSVAFRINKPAGSGSMTITPNSDTYFKAMYGMQGDVVQTVFGDGLYHADPSTAAVIPANMLLDDKMYCFIYGATAIEELDFSDMLSASGTSVIDMDFAEAYDDVLGASIKSLKLGEATTPNIYINSNASSYTSSLNIGQNVISAVKGTNDALGNLEHLDVIGWVGQSQLSPSWLSDLLSGTNVDRSNIKSVYALGCNRQTSFSSSPSGNNFTDLKLPNSILSITMNNSSWESISFWSSVENGNTATYTNVGIPSSIRNIYLTGSTGKNECSWTLVNSWIASILNDIRNNNPGATSDELEELLLADLSSRNLVVDQMYWGTRTALTYRDILRLYAFNGTTPVEKLGKLKGYVRIHEDNITSTLLSRLEDMFGTNVFNIGSQSSSLVVDNETSIVRISVSPSPGVSITEQNITLTEANSAVISANHFTLTADAVPNVIIDNTVIAQITQGGSVLASRLNPNTYYWGLTLSDTNHNDISTWNSTPPYLNFSKTVTGKVLLNAEVGDGNDYVAYVKVYYKNDLGELQTDEITVDIEAASYPEGYTLSVTESNGNLGRKFYCTQRIATDVFTQEYAIHNLQQTDAYVMYSNGCTYKFSLDTIGSFTAPITNVEYRIRNIDNVANNSGWLSYLDLKVGDNSIQSIGYDDNLAYTKNSTDHELVLKVIALPTSGYIRYALDARITIGSSSVTYRYANILVMSDSSAMISPGQLASEIKSKYFTDYQYTIGSSEPIYKYQLLGLDGTLSIVDNTYIDSLEDSYGSSIFTHTKYLTGVYITGCTSLRLSSTQYIFTEMPYLLELSFNGCTGISSGILDLTHNPLLSTLDLRDTSLGVVLSNNNASLSQLYFGSPYSITIAGIEENNIIQPVSISSVNNVTIQSQVNLQTLILEHIKSNGQDCTFNLFDKLYNAS